VSSENGTSPAERLRELLARDEMLVAPGAYDCISAKLIERAGFDAVYMTGAGTAAAHGYPDYGLVTMTEMVENAGRIVEAVSVPVIADADTGYGNELNAVRTKRSFAGRGVAAIQIEDQVFPKLCGHLDDKQLVARDEYLAKIAAIHDDPGPAPLVIARTDARAVVGLDEAVERANEALAAGADIAFVEAPRTLEEIAEVPRRVGGPCLFNLVRKGKSPEISLDEAERLGYRLTIVPGLLVNAAIAAGNDVLRRFTAERAFPDLGDDPTIPEFMRLFGGDAWDRVRGRPAATGA